jgi:hypothetical protein
LSFNLLREFSTPQKSVRFGIEAGPSWVNYSFVEIKLNPDYDPGRFLSYKYYKSRSGSSTIGAALRAKMEFLLSTSSPAGGVGLAAFANINKLKPFFGFELYFIFGGDINKKPATKAGK